MASVLDDMNLARPKSDTLMIDVAGFLLEYKRFSGYYENKTNLKIYLNVSVDDVVSMAVLDGINDWSDGVSSLLLTVELLLQNCIKQLQ